MAQEQTANLGRRDPEGRRRAVVDAAAELIIEHGMSGLTHRAVAARAAVSLGSTTRYFPAIDDLREAALVSLAEGIDTVLDDFERELEAGEGFPERWAALTREFLDEPRWVYASVALVTAGAVNQDLRAMAVRWSDRLTALLTPTAGAACAVAIDSYLNGVTMHAALHQTPIDEAELAAALRALLTMSTHTPEEN